MIAGHTAWKGQNTGIELSKIHTVLFHLHKNLNGGKSTLEMHCINGRSIYKIIKHRKFWVKLSPRQENSVCCE